MLPLPGLISTDEEIVLVLGVKVISLGYRGYGYVDPDRTGRLAEEYARTVAKRKMDGRFGASFRGHLSHKQWGRNVLPREWRVRLSLTNVLDE